MKKPRYNFSSMRHIIRMEHRQKKENKNGKRMPIRLLVLFLFAVVALVFLWLCASMLSLPIVEKYKSPILCVSLIAVLLTCATAVIFLYKEKITVYKSCLTVLGLMGFFSIVLWIAELTDFISILQSRKEFEEFLQSAGAYMPFIYILVQIIQVLFLPIPGAISILAGLQLFGALLTGIYSYIGIVLGSLIAFWIGRRWGNKGVAWLIGEETLEEWKGKMQGKDNLLLTAMFLLPFFPDDILCFVAGVSTMSTKYFIIMMLATRLFSVFSTCYSIKFIPFNTWWGILIWGILLVLMATAFILLYKNIEKVNNFMRKKRKKK